MEISLSPAFNLSTTSFYALNLSFGDDDNIVRKVSNFFILDTHPANMQILLSYLKDVEKIAQKEKFSILFFPFLNSLNINTKLYMVSI
jgi:uncharacterized protein YhhL (DUF1145 family)